MTDFFDDLERQLVAATPQRGARVRRARVRRAAAATGAVAVLLAGGAGIAAAVGGDGTRGGGSDSGAPAGHVATPPPPVITRTTANPPARGSYVVAVLNGTTVPGLGRGVANRLHNFRYKIGVITSGPFQDRTRTTVYYRTTDCIPAASDVAATLRLANAQGEFALRGLTPRLRAVAGPDAAVVVVVGSDQNRPAGP